MIYLWDYWQGRTPVAPREVHELHQPQSDGRPPSDEVEYFNKGDYVPRNDLGTEQEFKSAIRKVQAQGGRVILYVEPFITDTDSDVARGWDRSWAIHDIGGKPKKQGEHLAGRYPKEPPLNVMSPPGKAGEPWPIYPEGKYFTMVPDLPEWQAH